MYPAVSVALNWYSKRFISKSKVANGKYIYHCSDPFVKYDKWSRWTGAIGIAILSVAMLLSIWQNKSSLGKDTERIRRIAGGKLEELRDKLKSMNK